MEDSLEFCLKLHLIASDYMGQTILLSLSYNDKGLFQIRKIRYRESKSSSLNRPIVIIREIFQCFIEICGLVVCFVLSHFRLMTNSKQLEAFLKIFLFDLMTCQSNQSGFGGQTSNSRSLFKTCRRRRWRRRPTR